MKSHRPPLSLLLFVPLFAQAEAADSSLQYILDKGELVLALILASPMGFC